MQNLISWGNRLRNAHSFTRFKCLLPNWRIDQRNNVYSKIFNLLQMFLQCFVFYFKLYFLCVHCLDMIEKKNMAGFTKNISKRSFILLIPALYSRIISNICQALHFIAK